MTNEREHLRLVVRPSGPDRADRDRARDLARLRELRDRGEDALMTAMIAQQEAAACFDLMAEILEQWDDDHQP